MSVQQAAIGIDLGSFKSVITAAKKGGVDVVCNEANFRETPVIVGFGGMERNIGEPGYTKYKSNFRDTVPYPTRFLGLTPDYPYLSEELKFLTCQVESLAPGEIVFDLAYKAGRVRLNAEQLTAAYITKLRDILEGAKLANTQAVLSVPDYYTQIERKCLLDAAGIAGFNVPRLINESTAIGLSYGLFRKAQLDVTPRHVAIIDFGHSKLTASLQSFTKQKMSVQYVASDRYLGAREMDYILLKYYQSMFMKQKGLDFCESKKAVMRCLEAAEKQRKTLSANSEAGINIEYFFEENDLNFMLKREELQVLVAPVIERIRHFLDAFRKVIEERKVALHSVEVVGGASRIPIFQTMVSEVMKVAPCKTLNASEAISRGAAMVSAYISPLFKVAAYGIQEKSLYEVSVAWNFVEEGKPFCEADISKYNPAQRSPLFTLDTVVPSTKSMKFKRAEAIELLVYYNQNPFQCPPCIAYLRSKPVKPEKADFSVQFKIKIGEDSLIRLQQHLLYEEWTEEEKVKKEGAEDEVKKINKHRSTPLKPEVCYFIEKHSQEKLHKFFEEEATMRNEDSLIRSTYERKNELQSLIYNTRQKLDSAYVGFYRAEKKQEYALLLDQYSDWLENDGWDSSRGQYVERIDKVKAFEGPIAARYLENQRQAQAGPTIAKELESLEKQLARNDAPVEHITAEERKAGQVEIQGFLKWYTEAADKQAKTAKFQKAVFTLAEVESKLKTLRQKVQAIMSKPKPAPPKEEKKDEKKEDKKEEKKEEKKAEAPPKSDQMEVE